jgi:hypothetical protein
MNESQRTDHAYHEDRLVLLLARRDALPIEVDPDSSTSAEIITVSDLARKR